MTPLPFLGVSSLMNCRALGSGFFFGQNSAGAWAANPLARQAFRRLQSAPAKRRVRASRSAFNWPKPSVGVSRDSSR